MSRIDLEKHLLALLEEHPDHFWTCIKDLDPGYLLIDLSDRKALLRTLRSLMESLFTED